MKKLAKLPLSVRRVMRDFALGQWGVALDYISETACLISFLDDGLQAILEEELSPIIVSGHIGLAGYTARIGTKLGPMTFDLISVEALGLQLATEVEWSSTVRKSGRSVKGRSCSVWTLDSSKRVQSLFTANWMLYEPPIHSASASESEA